MEHERSDDVEGRSRAAAAGAPTASVPALGTATVPVGPTATPATVLALQRSHGNTAVARWLARTPHAAILARATPELMAPQPAKAGSPRFTGDATFAHIASGGATLAHGSTGLAVVKLQQALVDIGYALKVDGTFGDATETVLAAFQTAASVYPSHELDKDTLDALNKRFDTRRPYIDNAAFDPAHPSKGTRTLKPEEIKAIRKAMVPPRGTSGTSSFVDDVGGDLYGDDMRDTLTTVIDALHKELFEDKEPLRADPAKNFHDWSRLEEVAAASKDVVDRLYGGYVATPAPAMTHASGNFIDQWEDELTRDAGLTDPDKTAKARTKVWYLIASNCDATNAKHLAVPTDAKEKAILKPIVETFIDTPAKVQRMLELDIGWEGAQLEGVVYLQRYKKATDAENRKQMWELFHTCIHEYIHSLAHPKFQAYARRFESSDPVRYNTLIEGFDELFTLTVRKTVVVDTALRQRVEGPYYDAAAPVPKVDPDVYGSVAQAEQVTSIAGIRNSAAAYFRGDISKIGG